MNKRFLLLKTMVLLLLFVEISCKNQVLPEPVIKNTSSSSSQGRDGEGTFSCPQEVKASHGLKNTIELSWQPVSKAQWYYIYKADLPNQEFTKIGQTSATNTTYSMSVKAGDTFYYKVSAQNIKKVETQKSLWAMGTSLAKPFISSIEPSSQNPDSEITVFWYMNNVKSSTYRSRVRYHVVCLDEAKKMFDEGLVSGADTDKTQYTFTGLNSHTNYSFYIEAYLVSNQNAVEKSDTIDKKTARRLRPNAPLNVIASTGSFIDKVSLSFTTPEMVDVALGKNNYKKMPLYFKIFRRLKTDGVADGEWDEIVSYLGANKALATKAGTRPIFTTPIENSDKIDMNKDSVEDELYEYEDGQIITWNDTLDPSSIKRGVKYEYKVQSYADNVDRIISSNKSYAKATGWMIAIPSFSLGKEQLTISDPDSEGKRFVKSVSIPLILKWDALGMENEYSILIKENRKLLKVDNGDVSDENGKNTFIKENNMYFFNISTIENYKKEYVIKKDTPEDVRGYYSYEAYLIPNEKRNSLFTEISKENCDTMVVQTAAADSVPASGILLVSELVSIPAVESFSARSSYAKKAILSWIKQANIEYEVKRVRLSDTGDELEPTSITIETNEAFKRAFNSVSAQTADSENKFSEEAIQNGTITFVDTSLEEGKHYKYTLHAKIDTIDKPSDSKDVKTLGIPHAEFVKTALSYNSVTVKLPVVQCSKVYTVSLRDKTLRFNENGKKVNVKGELLSESGDVLDDESLAVDETGVSLAVDKVFTIKMDDLEGSNDARVSGSDFSTLIKATSLVDDTADDETTSSTIVRTLGPALIATATEKAHAYDSISVRWNKIEGAQGYVIKRISYDIPKTGAERALFSSTLYVSKDGDVSLLGEAVNGTTVSFDSDTKKYTLFDKVKELPTENVDNYKKAQSMISWGTPFTYTVIPVLSSTDSSDMFELYGDTLSYKKGSTIGYGHNIVATKAESTESITVSWTPPCGVVENNIDPFVFYRPASSTYNQWKSVSGVSSSSKTSCTFSMSHTDDSCASYDFLVVYRDDAIAFNEDYINKLETTLDENGEQFNAGYKFVLKENAIRLELPENTDTSFNEYVQIMPYNSAIRKVGPDGYTIYIKNKQKGNSWYTAAEITGDLSDIIVSPESPSWADITVEKNPDSSNGFLFRPTSLKQNQTRKTVSGADVSVTTGTSNGLLCAMRDYKHYYSIEAWRVNKAGQKLVTSAHKNNDPLYTYRNISDDEFCKNVLHIVADAFDQTGVYNAPTKFSDVEETHTGHSGVFYTVRGHYGWIADDIKYGTRGDYVHKFGSFISPFTINIPETGLVDGSSAGNLYELPWATIKTTHPVDLPSYKGYVLFRVWNEWNIHIQYAHGGMQPSDDKKINIDPISGEGAFREWAPFHMDDGY